MVPSGRGRCSSSRSHSSHDNLVTGLYLMRRCGIVGNLWFISKGCVDIKPYMEIIDFNHGNTCV